MAKKTTTRPRPHAPSGERHEARPAPKKPAHPTASGPAVEVRMYRLQLGDCFLLSFPKDGGGKFHWLIDCGLIQGAEDPKARLTEVAQDVKERTGGNLDLVVITHEHWDHVSGFSAAQAQGVFKDITFQQLWLAWTEDPADELARTLRAGREARRRALAAAVRQLSGPAAAPEVALAEALLAFHGGLEAADNGTAAALQWVKDHAARTRFCRPGEALDLPGVSGVRVYVLGPPHDQRLLHRSAPSSSHPETYLGLAGAGADAAAGDPTRPFDPVFRLDRDQAQRDPFFQARYGFEKGPEDWRRIDTDWQGAIGPLALQLDSDTNNTSLALAVELPGGSVLLFPGDAQVGNWLSWQALSWPGEGGARVTVNDLFARTVLYKVGHHGSHNATLRQDGLERMTRPDLKAMLPVMEQFANDIKHWKMPWPDLYAQLKERTGERILRADQARPVDYADVQDLYIELSIPL